MDDPRTSGYFCLIFQSQCVRVWSGSGTDKVRIVTTLNRTEANISHHTVGLCFVAFLRTITDYGSNVRTIILPSSEAILLIRSQSGISKTPGLTDISNIAPRKRTSSFLFIPNIYIGIGKSNTSCSKRNILVDWIFIVL